MEQRSDPTVFRLHERGSEPEPVKAAFLGRKTRVPSLSRIVGSLRGPRQESGVCPLCGWTADQYTTTRLLGCGLCHTVFAELIASPTESRPTEQGGQP